MGPESKESEPVPVGVSVVIEHEDKILLGHRLKDPNRGKLVIPGGKQKAEDVSAESTAEREALEEANAEISNLRLLMESEPSEADRVHRLTYIADLLSSPSEIKAGDDLGDPRFYSKNELQELQATREISEVVIPVLQKANWL